MISRNGSLAEPRAGLQALLLNDGRVLVAGGYLPFYNDETSTTDITTLEIYDPAKGKSVVVKPPANIRKLPGRPAVVLLADGKVLIAGGSYDNGASSSNMTLIFDPASGGFTNGPLMAKPRQYATATLLGDGQVLIAGGDDEGSHGQLSSAEVIRPLDPQSKSTLVGDADPVFWGATSTMLSDGRVLVVGRLSSGSEVFDPRTERFAPVGPMTTPRYEATSIKIQDGRVINFGGWDSKGAPAGTVEAFDPGSGTFQVIAAGFPEAQGFSATLLKDGRILVAGGYEGNDWLSTDWTETWFIKA